MCGVMMVFNGEHMINRNGLISDFWSQGLIIYSIIMTVQFFNIILLVKSWNVITIMITFGSYLLFWITTVLYTCTPFISRTTTLFMAIPHLFHDPSFFLALPAIVFLCVLPLIIYSLSSGSMSDYVRRKELS